jgi:hypothetical protein
MKHFICISVILIFFFISKAFCQNDSIENSFDAIDTLEQNFGLFTNEEVLNISLRFDVTEYRRKKPKDKYMPAILTYHINQYDSINKEISLKSRGIMRNSYCNFPPLRLNFKKNSFVEKDLIKLDKVKVVTHCSSGHEIYLFKEYLIYKLYNVLTDFSYKVRLLNINYIDTNKKNKSLHSHAFIIEPTEFLAERIDATQVESLKLTMANIENISMNNMAIFNYMIGNTDWSVPNQHNCKVFQQRVIANHALGVIVPFDFDYAGLINASYAIPNENLGTQSVTQRVFMGICRPEAEYIKALEEFSYKKDEFYNLIKNFEYLNDKSKKEMLNYLDQFYRELEKPSLLVTVFRNSCKSLK